MSFSEKVVKYLGVDRSTGYDTYQLSGVPQASDDGSFNLWSDTNVSITATTKSMINAHLDAIPVAYGYAYVPDGFFPKFKSTNWSYGIMAALGLGMGVDLVLGPNGSVYGKEWDLFKPPVEYYEPTTFGAVAAQAGIKVGGDLTVNGLEGKSSASAYARFYGGVLATFNTKANKAVAPLVPPTDLIGTIASLLASSHYSFNGYFDVNVSDFLKISGLSVSLGFTPYANFSYGLFLPQKWKVVGGWSLAKISLGFENPVNVTVCVDGRQSCPSAGGAGVANVYGVINNGNFNSVNRPENGMGDILTVTQNAWLSNPTKLAVGQLVTGQGVESGTRIKAVLDSNKQGDRYQVEQCDPAGLNCAPTQQLAIGGGEGFGSGKDPRLTAYTPGSNVSLTWGSSGLLTFHAGILEAFSLLKGFNSYDTKIPLYTMKPRVLLAL